MLLAGQTTRSAVLRRRRRIRHAAAVAVAAAVTVPAGAFLAQPASAAPAPTVSAVALMDTDTGNTVAWLDREATVVDLPFLPPHLTVRAYLQSAQSVSFTPAGGAMHPESVSPYTMAGEAGAHSVPVPALSAPGTVDVDLAPYELTGLKGVKGAVTHRRIQIRKPTFVVNTTGDYPDAKPGDGVCASTMLSLCTLRAAVQEANALAGRQDVSVPAGTYALPLGELAVTGSTGIWGHGRPHLVADQHSRALRVATTGTVQAEDLDMTGGDVDFGQGGVVAVQSGRLDLSRSDVHGGTANMGGGIAVLAAGTLNLSTTTVHHNTAGDPQISSGAGATQRGGGVYSNGTTDIDSSSITDNKATFGGGLSNRGGHLWMGNSSLMGNVAVAIGGGLENTPANGTDAVLRMWFTTITNNKAGYTASSLPLASRGGGGFWNADTLWWGSNVVAQNDANWSGAATTTPDCSSTTPGGLRSLGTNLLGVKNAACSVWSPIETTLSGGVYDPLDPQLGYRGDYPMAARVPFPSSPAVTHGTSDSSCPARDVRGIARTQPCSLGSAQG